MKKPILMILVLIVFITHTRAQTTEFTYQGKLNANSVPANGNYDLEFSLYPSADQGTTLLGTILLLSVPVRSGVFTVRLQFGNQFTGEPRFLEIKVAPEGSGTFTTLSPRQPILSTPYAQRSLNATSADNALSLGGLPAGDYVVTSDVRMSNERLPMAGSSNYVRNGQTSQAGVNFNVGGSGEAAYFIANQYNIGNRRVLSIAGTENMFAGRFTGELNTSGQSNTFVGDSAGFGNTTGSSNAYFGTRAGSSGTNGGSNSFFGFEAGLANTAAGNSFFGNRSGVTNGIGGANAFFGSFAGFSNTTGSSNTFIGEATGLQNTTGSNNLFVGRGAGGANTQGISNTLIGHNSNVGSNSLTNATAIGAGAIVSRNNSVVLGTPTNSVGIGTTAPASKLHVANGSIYVEGLANGVILTSPDGNCWIFRVTNAGTVSLGPVACPM